MEIELRGLTVQYTSHGPCVLNNIDLMIRAGEHVALLGPSGSGKTTLLRVVLGAVRPVAGQVRVDGLDPFGSPAHAARIRRQTGMVRQRDDLVRGLSARTNILMGAASKWRITDWWAVMRGVCPPRYQQRLVDLAVRHDIDPLLDNRVEDLSGGQRQRVALARAMLPRPRLLLADESTAGLDPLRAAAAVAHMREPDGATLVLTTHDRGLAEQFPRVVALRDGHVVFDSSVLDDCAIGTIYGPSVVGVPT